MSTAACTACVCTLPQRQVPRFKTMFSSLRHYPRQALSLDVTDPVPPHVPRQWKGYGEQARNSLIRYKKCVWEWGGSVSISQLPLDRTRFNYAPSVTVPAQHYADADVEGRNRYKFFRRPIIPFLPQLPPSVVLAPTRCPSPSPLPLPRPSASI